MKRKARVRRAVAHEPVDRLPTQISYTEAAGARLAAHLGVAPEALPGFLDNHLLRVDLDYPARLSPDGLVRYDWWGVGFSTREEGYFTALNPLAGEPDLDAFPWPDPQAPGLFDRAAAMIAADGGERFVIPNFGFALFERAWALRGFEAFLMDLVLAPDFAAELLERITGIQLALIRRFLDLGVDGGYFGDDYGAQQGLLFSPKTWLALVKPRLARLFAPFRAAGLPVILHSDGQIAPILSDLVEIGLTVFNPVQPEVVDHSWLRAQFGDRLAYYGGISTQAVLPSGTPVEVRRAVEVCAGRLAPAGTGLVLAPSHRLMADIPLANFDALLEAFQGLSRG